MELVQVAIGLAATIIGVLAGHLLAVRSQRLAWAREDQQGRLTRQLAQKMEIHCRGEIRCGASGPLAG